MIRIPNIEMVKVGDLKTDGQNPNVMTNKQLDALKKNITDFGFIVPVITNKDMIIADGEQRWKAAKSLGMAEIPIIRLEVSDVDRRILRQVLNKLKGHHEKEGDMAEFIKIAEAEQIERMGELLAYDKAEMSQIMDMIREPVEVDVPEVPKETGIKKGDIYNLGHHRLMCGDSTNSQDVSNLMGNEKADMVFTDPPYNVSYKSKGGHGYSKGKYKHKKAFDDNKKDKEYFNFLKSTIMNINNSTNETCPIYFWHGITYGDFVKTIFRNMGYKILNDIVWIKEHLIMGHATYHKCYEVAAYVWKNGKKPYEAKTLTAGEKDAWMDKETFEELLDTWYVERDSLNEYQHPTQKPVKLAFRAIKNSSKEDDIVLDLFGGSGSTLIACEQLNRKCYMMELDPYYCQVIIDRWEQFTGKKSNIDMKTDQKIEVTWKEPVVLKKGGKK